MPDDVRRNRRIGEKKHADNVKVGILVVDLKITSGLLLRVIRVYFTVLKLLLEGRDCYSSRIINIRALGLVCLS